MERAKIENRFRIIVDEKRAFGMGPCMLLERVDKLGSLNKACRELNMSYSKAWSTINNAENLLGFQLLESQIGGIDGGGSVLTAEAKDLIEAYKDFAKEAERILDELFRKHFKMF